MFKTRQCFNGNMCTLSRNGLVMNYRYFINFFMLCFSYDDWQVFEVAVTVFLRDDSSAMFVLNLIF